MATHYDGLHKLEGQVESALAGEAVQNGYAESAANPTSSTLSPHLLSGKESAATTVAGSRDPTIKHTDSASTHSNRTGHDEKALSTNEKALSDGGKDSDAEAHAEEDTGLLHGLKLYLVFVALMLSVFVRVTPHHPYALTVRCSPWTSQSSLPLSPSSSVTLRPLTVYHGSSPRKSSSRHFTRRS
jgi:hypothetical protein